jgi:NAD(P)-dependent dehydrogenase (short-subunit alcohol dehydrogenase family)
MIPREFDIEGKTVIVTGAARGIGKGVVRVLAEAGAKVLVTALTDSYLAPFRDEMASSGHPIDTLVADGTDADEWSRTVEYAIGLWGHIDALVNNIGDAISKPLIPEPDAASAGPLSDDEWRKVIDVNLTHAFLGCRAVGPHFQERRSGRVVNISGIRAKRGVPGLLAYSAAKAGLVRLTQTLALEWARYGINVNSIAPGSFPDPELAGAEALAAGDEHARTSIPLGRVGVPREVGLLTLYLISAASDYMTGETIYLDGGLTDA